MKTFYLGFIAFCLSAQTPQKPGFWGWDAETWTAVGTVGATIVALALALIGAFAKSVNASIQKPRLKPLVKQLSKHSELIAIDGQGWWQLRVPIINSGLRGAATNVEVFLSGITKENDDDSFLAPTYLPIRLHWTHAGGQICPRIPAGVNRLLDFGKVSPSTHVLRFDTEISLVNEVLVLPSGSYILKIIVAADNVTRQFSLRARLEDEPKGQELTELLKLDLI
jgi:hypothetical protein